MRVESSLVQQPLIDSTKVAETKEVKANNASNPETVEEPSPFSASPFSFSGTYSPTSLKAAVDYHAKLLTVAENNMEAVNHPPTIPKGLLDRFNVR